VTSEAPQPPGRYGHSEATLWEAAEKASRLLEPRSLGVLCRKPLADEDCPEVSDVDLLSIWERPEEYPERITVESSTGRVFVDILWIPVSKLLDPAEAASYKILPHLLLDSETVWMRSDSVEPLVEHIRLSMYEKAVWERRIGNQINFGDAALQEASKNLDFPPAALFFLQTAHSYYMMALADCLKHSIMTLLTRPMTKLRRMAAETGCEMERLLMANLHLETEPSASLEALERVYSAVSAKCSARQPQGVSGRTRGHYAYSLSPLELEYRVTVAEALITRVDSANANFYIRFWAYALSRCPVVIEDARQGRNPSFYVPYGGFKESLQAACPEIVDDMELILGGKVTRAEAEVSIAGTAAFRRLVTDQIRKKDLRLTSSRDSPAVGSDGAVEPSAAISRK
jgi:hypothetical protein